MVIHQPVPPRLEGRQWKSILTTEFGASRRLLRQFARDNSVRVNGQPVYLTSRASAGDVMDIHLPKETSPVLPEPHESLRVAYEDDEVLVVDKPPGVLSHPSARELHGSILASAAGYLQKDGWVPHCVHRLDRDTSGLLMLAKHAHFHHLYDTALRRGLMHRTYVAIVHNPSGESLSGDEWRTIDLPVAGDPTAPSKRIIDESGKRAVTHFVTLRRLHRFTLVAVRLETGRTHQIRIHFSQIGAPLVGDPHYSGSQPSEAAKLLNRRPAHTIQRQALHAIRLDWKHPLSLEDHTAYAQLPSDMMSFWLQAGGAQEDFGRAQNLVTNLPTSIQPTRHCDLLDID